MLVGLILVIFSAGLSENLSPTYGKGKPAADGVLAPFFMPSVQFWGAKIESWAEAHALDPNLVATIMQIESCGDPLAKSSAGAQGLFQVMPLHFSAGEDAFSPEINAARGLAYLQEVYNYANGNIAQTLAGYNGGIGMVNTQPDFWYAETQHYVLWGSGIYADAVAGQTESLTLQRWLAAGGQSLCLQAEARLNLSE